ncbi:hypothetical protein ECHJAX_0460 [Ehrlichia chaffeensis str. Jax]|nr:hypothetical protein ECHJAX_0460 [Ehrlichia chaffeensis str. Jax]
MDNIAVYGNIRFLICCGILDINFIIKKTFHNDKIIAIAIRWIFV